MKIADVLYPVVNEAPKEIIIAALYYAENYFDKQALTAREIRNLLMEARAPMASTLQVPMILKSLAPYVDKAGKKGNATLWTLTQPGQQHARNLLDIPESKIKIKHDVNRLNTLVDSVTDQLVADYIKESVICLSVDALRAAVVFLWSGAIRTIQEKVLAYGAATINPIFKKHDPKARDVKKIGDFAYIKDSTTLLVAKDLGLFDKSQYGILKECLDLRNRLGHPGKYMPGTLKVSSYIEDLLNVVFK